jgi:hypothetical protein
MYNLGVSLLHAGRPIQAFDCLTEAVQVYHMNPRLWLRLAECCVMAHKAVSNMRHGGYNWTNLFLEDINTGTWLSRFGRVSYETMKYGCVLQDLDPRVTALARLRSSCTSRLPTYPCLREGA